MPVPHPESLLFWDLSFVLAGLRGLPSLLGCEVGRGLAGVRGWAGKAIMGSVEKPELCSIKGQCFSLTPSGYPFSGRDLELPRLEEMKASSLN